MSSSPVTASSESDSPSNSSSSDSHPSPPSPESSSPPPSGSGSDESEASPPPPPASSSPPPTSQNSSSSDVSPPPPPRDKSSSGPSSSRSGNPPPPPPHSSSSGKTPSDSTTAISPSGSKSRQSPPRDGNDDNNGKIIAGVAIGIGLLIVMLIIICVRRAGRKKKKRKQYCYGGPPTGGENCYDDTPHNLQWHNKPQGVDHVVKLSPQAGGWVPAPPPMAHSSEDSSTFSGPHGPPMPPPSPSIALGINKSTFTYEELAAATGGFAQANLLGQGGFGYVHKGVLPNGKEVAVKSLKSGSGQGEREFMAEVEIISRVHHRHLVSLVGYCVAGAQRMLVYEFVPNNTLEYHLHGKGLPVMDFSRRLRIALGSAKGLAYIHEDCYPRIIHRDIKSANILLDYNFEAMVADFGLAKLSSDSYTHVSTRVMGTFGYLAPEYASSGKLTEKSDVFSFGIMLLELITGKPPVDVSNVMEDSLVDWARPLLTSAMEDGNYDELADPRLELNYNPQEMARMVTCAAASIRHSARKRPKMSQIVRALEGDVSLDDLNEGIKPGHSSIYSMGSDYSQSSYHADMKKFRQIALASTEFPSSEYGTSSNDSREAPTSRKPN